MTAYLKPFFRPEDFMEVQPGNLSLPFEVCEVAERKLEASFGNEYQIVMFWKEKMLEEREEVARLRDVLWGIRAEANSWVLTEETAPCQKHFHAINEAARAALEEK